MSSHTLGILIGGLLPAFGFTVANLASKTAAQSGISIGWYITIIGLSIVGVGLLFSIAFPVKIPSTFGVLSSVTLGVTWALGISGILIALQYYGMSIGVISTIFNLNALFTVVFALWIFAEWKNVHVPQLLIGSVFVVFGAILVSRA